VDRVHQEIAPVSSHFIVGGSIAVSVASWFAPIGAPDQTVFRARTDAVSLTVSVMKGKDPVIGLGATDFTLTDNGVPQTVEVVSLDQVPIDVTIVLTGYPTNSAAAYVQGLASAEATRRLLLPSDRLRLVTVNDHVRGGLTGPRFTVHTMVGDRLIPGVALVDGLFYALAWPVEPDRRHLVVAFTNGWDKWSTLEPDRLPQLAERSDAVLHAVFWSTPSGAQTREWTESYRLVETAARRTGGTIQTTAQVPKTLAGILADFRTSYVLQYTPRDVPARGWHELRVKLRRPGSFTLRTRKGYEGR
jgi:hypothetical protein